MKQVKMSEIWVETMNSMSLRQLGDYVEHATKNRMIIVEIGIPGMLEEHDASVEWAFDALFYSKEH